MLKHLPELENLDRALPISYSKAKCLFNCPRMFQMKYISKPKADPPPNPDTAKVGKCVHSVLEKCLIKGQLLGYNSEKASFSSNWEIMRKLNSFTEEEVSLVEGLKENSEITLNKMLTAIQKYSFTITPELQLIMTKSGRIVPDVDWPLRFFLGYVDFYAENPNKSKALLLDFKTHSSSEQHLKDAQQQLGLYTHFIFLRNPKLVSVQYGPVFIPDSSIKTTNVVRGSDEHKEIIQDANEFIYQFKTTLQTTDFKVTPGHYCSWCNYSSQCSIEKD